MFRSRRKAVPQSPSAKDEAARNAWNEKVLKSINGRDTIDIQLFSMQVFWDYNAEEYSDAIQPPYLNIHGRQHYLEKSITLRGVERPYGIACEISIQPVPSTSVADEAAAGLFTLRDIPIFNHYFGTFGSQQVPVISIGLRDAEGGLVEGLRNSFLAATPRRAQPEMRVFLSRKIEASSRGLRQGFEPIKVKRFILWEVWGHEPLEWSSPFASG